MEKQTVKQDKYFNIWMEPKLAGGAFEGKLSKTTGGPEGDVKKMFPQSGGTLIPNYSLVWAKRGADGTGAAKKLNGKLEFLPWNTEGGEAVEIRYRKDSSSLDKQYQDQVQKLKPISAENAQIKIMPGLTEINAQKEPLFVEFLKHHSWFEGNESRNPEIRKILFKEYVVEARITNKKEALKKKTEAVQIVLDAETQGNVTVLASLFGLDVASEEGVLVDKLLDIIEKPTEDKRTLGHDFFLNNFREKKSEISEVFAYAIAQDNLKGENGKQIKLLMPTGNREAIVTEETVQVGDSTLEFLMDNILKDEFYDAYKLVEKNNKELAKA